MAEQNPDKLNKKLRLVEEELAAIKSSRTYRAARAAGSLKAKVHKDPVGVTKKMLKTMITDPGRLVRLAKGGEVNSGLGGEITNRAVQYQSWILLTEPNEEELLIQKKLSQNLKYKPLFSIVTPVFNPPVEVLRDLLESVLNQTYPYFELCLGNFGQSDQVKRLLDEYVDRDSRIKVYEYEENLGISGNSNLILEKVVGEFVALLDHDDSLSPDALHENALLLNQAEYDFIYSDKDMIDEQGKRYEPFFKPDLCPETMLNANYLTHFDVMRTSLVRDVGGWDPETDGAQDWDLFLKLMESTSKITHIHKILYHWRVIATSTAHSIETKPYALAGQRKAVQKYLDKQGISAKPFHTRTEMLLNWGDDAVKTNPLVIINSHTVADTVHLLSDLVPAVIDGAKIMVVHGYSLSDTDEELLRRSQAHYFMEYKPHKLSEALNNILNIETYPTFILVDDGIRIPKEFNYKNFVGWLSITEIGVVGAKIIDRSNLIVDCGSVLTPNGIKPLFKGYPSYYQGYQGNVEWVRNLHVTSRGLFAFKKTAVNQIVLKESATDEEALIELMLKISKTHRLVTNPKTVAISDHDSSFGTNQTSLIPLITEILDVQPVPGTDKYSNPNLNSYDPMRLSTDHIDSDTAGKTDLMDSYQHDALILSQTFDLTKEEINTNKTQPHTALNNIQSAGWFLPAFDAIYAGLNNIFSFAEHISLQEATTYFFLLKSDDDVSVEQGLVTAKYPGLVNAKFIAIRPNSIDKIPPLDVGICTQWSTAYSLAKCINVKRKCYFIQDNEPNFYPMGSISALADLTYRLGFYGIANTEGLLDLYQKRYNGRGTVLKSLVSLDSYHPRKDPYYLPEKPYRVFFYARPSMPRNAFELGIAGLTKLKQQLGDKVEIIAAGAVWNPDDYGVGNIINNIGKIPYEDVPKFYRSLDAGMMFMFSGHPGVIASELMASGCPVVVNEYDDPTWHELYKHEATCLITTPTASEIARSLIRCLEDTELRKKLIDGGLAKTSEFYKGYKKSQKNVVEAIKRGS